MNWRARHYKFRLSKNRQLVVSARRFKIAKANRAKSFKQLVLPLRIGSLKEVAFKLEKFKPQRSFVTLVNFRRLIAPISYSLVAVGLIGAGFFSGLIYSGSQIEPVKTFVNVNSTRTKPSIDHLASSLPTHLSIPSLDINASVAVVGKTATGAIKLPPMNAVRTVGWYKHSPTPGQVGPAVIVGHVDNRQTTSVFWRLRGIKPGASIFIKRQDGTIAKFKVTQLERLPQVNFPTEEVYGNIDFAGLRLITCAGRFDSQTGRYTENIVVYAALAKPNQQK